MSRHKSSFCVTVISAIVLTLSGAFTANAAEYQDISLPQSVRDLVGEKIEDYTQWLEKAYVIKNSSSDDKSDQPSREESDVVDRQTDYIVDAFESSGLTIETADVTADVISITGNEQNYTVTTSITTAIEYSRTNENRMIVRDTCWWTDSHAISISFVSDKKELHTDSDDQAEDCLLTSDSIVSDEEETEGVDLLDEDGVAKTGETGMTYEQALAARPSGEQASINPTAAGTPSIPNYMDGVNYALKWTDYPYSGDEESDFNPDYPYFDDNCTNFVSQAIHESDVPYYTGISIDTKSLDFWTPDLLLGHPTWTWNNADYNYKFMKKNFYNAFDSPWMDMGGLIYVDWGGNDGVKDHAMIVTQADRSFVNGQMVFNTYISQKTNNRHNIPLSVEMGIAYQTHPNAKWYGLGLRWS